MSCPNYMTVILLQIIEDKGENGCKYRLLPLQKEVID